MSPVFASQVLTPLIESSSEVLASLQNGTDVTVQIPIFGLTHNTTNSDTTSRTPLPTTGIPLSSVNNIPTTGENISTTTTFTEADLQNIKDLCELGFQENQVIRIYTISNRNKELAASMLYDFIE
jgi:hypothetical protein